MKINLTLLVESNQLMANRHPNPLQPVSILVLSPVLLLIV